MYFTDISDETIREIISPPEAALPCPPLEGVGGGIERMVLFVQEAEQSTRSSSQTPDGDRLYV